MRILVFSDSHGRYLNMKKAIEANDKAEHIIFCGDGQKDISDLAKIYSNKHFYCVSGNCDMFAKYPKVLTIQLEGKNIFITHGDHYYVKSGYNKLIEAVADKEIDIAVFGHTHEADRVYLNGKHYLNPGSCSGAMGTFATIDIQNGEILTNIISCDKL